LSDFTYELPAPQTFLYTLRRYLEAVGRSDIAELLSNSSCEFLPSSSYSSRRWNTYYTTCAFRVPVTRLASFIDDVRGALYEAVQETFPKEAGYEIHEVQISPLLENPPDDERVSINSASLVFEGTIEHDGLRFRSRAVTRIYDALKKHDVLFFANASAILGGKGIKREPDFLVCQNGRWGILEVMGDQYHPSATAMRDHDRGRLFKDYGLYYIEFYDAHRCYTDPDGVVQDSLSRLAKA
jgi:hypothetical protein